MNLHSAAAALYEAMKPRLGEHPPAEVQKTLEHELAHLLPTWSQEKPTCPGLYWHKPPGIAEPRLLTVDHGRIDTKLMADLGPPNNLVDVNRIAGLWAGPILPPWRAS
jgi:hypothetical protein